MKIAKRTVDGQVYTIKLLRPKTKDAERVVSDGKRELHMAVDDKTDLYQPVTAHIGNFVGRPIMGDAFAYAIDMLRGVETTTTDDGKCVCRTEESKAHHEEDWAWLFQ